MKLTPQTLSANGDSPWIVPGPLLISPSVALALTFSSNANLTASVYYTYDETTQPIKNVSLSRTGTALTVNYPNHGLNVADTTDLVSVTGSYTGNFDVGSITDQNNFVVTVANSGPATDTAQARIYKLFEQESLASISGTPPTRIDGFLDYPAAAVRLKVTNWVAGSATLTASQPKGY